MWVGYAWKVLGLKSSAAQQRGQGGRPLNPQVVGPIVASMDYHGAEVEVARCGCVGRVGTKGIVVRETKFTIMVVTRKNGMKSKWLSQLLDLLTTLPLLCFRNVCLNDYS